MDKVGFAQKVAGLSKLNTETSFKISLVGVDSQNFV